METVDLSGLAINLNLTDRKIFNEAINIISIGFSAFNLNIFILIWVRVFYIKQKSIL